MLKYLSKFTHMPNVDVIIPTHNCIFIAEAIESVIHQTHQNINIIIIDDGSNNDTRDTVQRYRNLYPGKIIYYYQHHQGPAAARNTGFKKSSNEYIAFLDADDIWLPEKIEKQLLKFKNDLNIGFVYCDNYFIDKSGNIIKDYVRKVKLVEGDILLDFFMDFFLITSGIMLKRSCLERTGMFDENLEVGEDFDFFLRLAQNYKAGVVKEKLFKRRVWKESLSKQDYEKNQKIDISTLKKFYTDNHDFYSKYKKIIKKRLSEMYFKFGYAYLENCRNLKAIKQFLNSSLYEFNPKVLKNLVACLMPCKIRKYFRDKLKLNNLYKYFLKKY